MARYLAVVAVQREGLQIASCGACDPPQAGEKQPAVAQGRRLIAVVNNGEWQSAIDVTFRASYDRVYRRFREGIWKRMDLYSLDERRAAELEDGRRILMNGQPAPDPARAPRSRSTSRFGCCVKAKASPLK